MFGPYFMGNEDCQCCGCDLIAGFTYTNPHGWYFEFEDTSTSSETIISWDWDFGDGDTSTVQNPTHAFTTQGPYTVTLIVNDGVCEKTIVQVIPVRPFIECSNCTPDDLPEEIQATLVNGTSSRSCSKCLNQGGTYVLENVAFCYWLYEETAFCNYCLTGNFTGQYLIELQISNAGGSKIIRVTVRFSFVDTGSDFCKNGEAIYEKVLGSGSQDCRGAHTLTKISSQGLEICTHANTISIYI